VTQDDRLGFHLVSTIGQYHCEHAQGARMAWMLIQDLPIEGFSLCLLMINMAIQGALP